MNGFFCPQCGQPVEPEAKFCSECGSEAGQFVSAATPLSPPPEASGQTDTPPPQMHPQPPVPPPAGKGRRLHLLAITTVLLVAIAAAAAGGFLWGRKDTGSAEPQVDLQKNEVKIGSQTWMAKNLDVSTFRNGDPIPEAKTAAEWREADSGNEPAWIYYNNDPANGETYGKLYNWYAVNDSRGLCPQGWHVPYASEWSTLASFLGGAPVPGDNFAGGGFSSSNPLNYAADRHFYNLGTSAYFWTPTESSLYPSVLYWGLYHINGSVVANSGYGFWGDKGDGFSVRCVSDF